MRPANPGAALYFQGGSPMLRHTQMVLQVTPWATGVLALSGAASCQTWLSL